MFSKTTKVEFAERGHCEHNCGEQEPRFVVWNVFRNAPCCTQFMSFKVVQEYPESCYSLFVFSFWTWNDDSFLYLILPGAKPYNFWFHHFPEVNLVHSFCIITVYEKWEYDNLKIWNLLNLNISFDPTSICWVDNNRVDIPAHTRTAHNGLPQKRFDGIGSLPNHSWCSPNDPVGQGTELNWTDII